ncbi:MULTISPECIES: hypothetical protein [unclassified Pseudoalteromonas]|uniref:hypothetical protein n=1 Tax=unclassified Pseudoalteromonas TaxID=194690 RepID=UPI0005AAAB27|nr:MULTISPECIES: hypothetical protein [unclassified Pseudoalteromonas]
MDITIATVVKKDLIETDPSVELIAYSGRHMYGRRTIAITGNISINCIWKAIIRQREEIEQYIRLDDIDLRSDQFGLGTVVY